MTTPSDPKVTPGAIRISSMLWIRKRPVCSTQSSMNGSRSACSASDSERYAPSTKRQYSRTSFSVFVSAVIGPKLPAGLSDGVPLYHHGLINAKQYDRIQFRYIQRKTPPSIFTRGCLQLWKGNL